MDPMARHGSLHSAPVRAPVLVVVLVATVLSGGNAGGSPAAGGAQLWVSSYNGPANSDDVATALGVSPGGSTVFVTGLSVGATSNADYATAAYDASTGA